MNATALGLTWFTLPLTILIGCAGSERDPNSERDAGAIETTHSGGAMSATGGSASAGSTPSLGGTVNAGGGTPSTGGASNGGATSAALDCLEEGDGKTTLMFVNRCVASVEYRGSDIAGGSLAPGSSACVDVGTATEAISSKRYWGFRGVDPGAGRYTLAEFTFNTDFYDLDWYNISHVDAHNLPMAILPAARAKCRQLSCPRDFLATCPAVGQYRDATGKVVSCVSPDRNDPNNPVVLLFEQCDDAYAWSGDDQNGTDVSPMIGCSVEDFAIVFCPEAT